MYIAATLTVPAVDTGYSLYDLLISSGIPASALPTSNRVCGLKLQRGSADAYVVPSPGAYVSTTANVPDQCGWVIAAATPFEVDTHPANQFSLKEINIGIDTANGTVRLFAYIV